MYPRVNWLGITADAAAMDAGFATLNADTEYINRLDASGDLIIPGSGNRMIGTRVA